MSLLHYKAVACLPIREDGFSGRMGAPPWPEAMTPRMKYLLEDWLEDIEYRLLADTILYRRYA